jgi:hypothetical protein
MEDFSIITQMTLKEYSRVMFFGLYKKPSFILTGIFGLYLTATVVLNYFQIINYYTDTPYLEMFCGLFLLLAPTLITVISVIQFKSNPNLLIGIKQTFSDKGMICEGPTFKGDFLWTHFIKQKEIGKFLILYHSKRMGSFIDKTKLTKEQLEFIKTKANQK